MADIVMPGGLTGWDLAKRARAPGPTLPVLFTSGHPLQRLIARGRLDADAAILIKQHRRTDPATWRPDPASVEAAITLRTRAIIGVDLYGSKCD